ncbi:MAG: ribosome maturation factor RimP [Alphaproteobacteria bacterium]|jgi:ribosome maturation factor RimP|nr:ribosome maturation factor RimP [Alphaproteobacteria bacterium]MCV6599441.1 ribosome maturation factor RimP [Alphaproteobacteria bacterium]
MTESKLDSVISSSVKGLGYTFVLADFHANEDKSVLRIMIENKDGSGVTVEDCKKVSKSLSAVLDVEDIISSAYRLEVSSTGMDRPLVRIEDYERFKGFLIKMEAHELVGGRKRFKGVVLGTKENVVSLEMPEGKIEIDFDNIKKAKLIITDEMIREAMKKGKR